MSHGKIGVALLGYGYWGPNVLRNMWAASDFAVQAVVDSNPARLSEVEPVYPGLATFTSVDDLLASALPLDAVVVATPPATHAHFGAAALERGAHVLMAKPLATTSADARRLAELARDTERVLLVDHTYVYTGAVRQLRHELAEGTLGRPLYYSSVRVNLGLFQSDTSVLWDLMPHDLSIMQVIFRSRIARVSATAHAVTGYQQWDIANATIWLESGVVGFANVSWVAPTKVRLILVGGTQRSAVYDDLEATEKVRVYDKGVSIEEADEVSARREVLVQYRLGDVRIPHLDAEEALSHELRHFAACIRGEDEPLTNAEAGIEVVAAIEAMEQSAALGGVAVDVLDSVTL